MTAENHYDRFSKALDRASSDSYQLNIGDIAVELKIPIKREIVLEIPRFSVYERDTATGQLITNNYPIDADSRPKLIVLKPESPTTSEILLTDEESTIFVMLFEGDGTLMQYDIEKKFNMEYARTLSLIGRLNHKLGMGGLEPMIKAYRTKARMIYLAQLRPEQADQRLNNFVLQKMEEIANEDPSRIKTVESGDNKFSFYPSAALETYGVRRSYLRIEKGEGENLEVHALELAKHEELLIERTIQNGGASIADEQDHNPNQKAARASINRNARRLVGKNIIEGQYVGKKIWNVFAGLEAGDVNEKRALQKVKDAITDPVLARVGDRFTTDEGFNIYYDQNARDNLDLQQTALYIVSAENNHSLNPLIHRLSNVHIDMLYLTPRETELVEALIKNGGYISNKQLLNEHELTADQVIKIVSDINLRSSDLLNNYIIDNRNKDGVVMRGGNGEFVSFQSKSKAIDKLARSHPTTMPIIPLDENSQLIFVLGELVDEGNLDRPLVAVRQGKEAVYISEISPKEEEFLSSLHQQGFITRHQAVEMFGSWSIARGVMKSINLKLPFEQPLISSVDGELMIFTSTDTSNIKRKVDRVIVKDLDRDQIEMLGPIEIDNYKVRYLPQQKQNKHTGAFSYLIATNDRDDDAMIVRFTSNKEDEFFKLIFRQDGKITNDDLEAFEPTTNNRRVFLYNTRKRLKERSQGFFQIAKTKKGYELDVLPARTKVLGVDVEINYISGALRFIDSDGIETDILLNTRELKLASSYFSGNRKAQDNTDQEVADMGDYVEWLAIQFKQHNSARGSDKDTVQNGNDIDILDLDEVSTAYHQYLQEPFLSTWEEQRLIREVQIKGNSKAKERILASNIHFVISRARKKRSGEYPTLVELIQEGNMGLLHALDMFDCRKKFTFLTYAKPWIDVKIDRAIIEQKLSIRLPTGLNYLLASLNRAEYEIKATDPYVDMESKATLAELARRIMHNGKPITPEKINQLRQLRARQVVDMHAPARTGDDTPMENFLHDPSQPLTENIVEHIDMQQRVLIAIDKLRDHDSRLPEIMKMRTGLEDGFEYSLEDISAKFGVTRERIRQLFNIGIEILSEDGQLEDLYSALTDKE